MVEFLSAGWLDKLVELGRRLPERPGASVCVEVVATGSPEGESVHHYVVEDGRIVAASLGPAAEADYTVVQPYGTLVRIMTGELDESLAFMRGESKVTGNMGKYVSLLPLTQSDDHRALLAQLDAVTEH